MRLPRLAEERTAGCQALAPWLVSASSDQALGHRTACAICRRVLLASVTRRSRIGADGECARGGGNACDVVDVVNVVDVGDAWALALPAAPGATRYPAVRAQRLAPHGYAIGCDRGRWTGWVCAPCAERLTVEEHQVGAQRALERRVAHLEQRLRFPVRNQTQTPTSPPVHSAGRHRAANVIRQQLAHSAPTPWIVSLEAYRAVRRELRACRQSLADLTATMVDVDDPIHRSTNHTVSHTGNHTLLLMPESADR